MSRLEIECLKTLPMDAESVKTIFDERHNWDGITRKVIARLCLSHERLRAEIAGANAVINDMETELKQTAGQS